MKVVLEPATGAVMTAKTEDGKEVRVNSVAIQPFFTTPNGPAQVVLGKSVDKSGKPVDTFGLTAAGATGKVSKGDRPSPKGAVPLIDKKAKAKPKPEAGDDEESTPNG